MSSILSEHLNAGGEIDDAYYLEVINSQPSIDSVVDNKTYINWLTASFPDPDQAMFVSTHIMAIILDTKAPIDVCIRDFLERNPDAVPRFAVCDEKLLLQDNRDRFFADLIERYADTDFFGVSRSESRYFDEDEEHYFLEDDWFVLNGLWMGKEIPEQSGHKNGLFCKESGAISGPVLRVPLEVNLALSRLVDEGFLPYNTGALVDALKLKDIIATDGSWSFKAVGELEGTDMKNAGPGI